MLSPTRLRIKICCISSAEEARLATEAGAHLLGLVSSMPSGPGVIDDEGITSIAAVVPDTVQTVLLTARRRAESIAEQHRRLKTRALQLVDEVPVAELRQLRSRLPGVQLIQVIHVVGRDSVARALEAAPWVDALLLDSGNPAAAVRELGGTGRTHDWSVSRCVVEAVAPQPVYLAGGLHSGNVAEAIRSVGPAGVDVCSGVRTLGRLDIARLRAFVEAARSASRPSSPAA